LWFNHIYPKKIKKSIITPKITTKKVVGSLMQISAIPKKPIIIDARIINARIEGAANVILSNVLKEPPKLLVISLTPSFSHNMALQRTSSLTLGSISFLIWPPISSILDLWNKYHNPNIDDSIGMTNIKNLRCCGYESINPMIKAKVVR
jgi:hypothetical protein